MRTWNLFNLRAQIFNGPVSVYPVRDVVPERVSKHPFSVVLVHAVSFTKAGKGMAAVVRRMLFYAEPLQNLVHVLSEGTGRSTQ